MVRPISANRCKWVRLESTDICGKPCSGEYCHSHNRSAGRGRVCKECGVGIKNDYGKCRKCGYLREWLAQRAFRSEFKRLAAINFQLDI
jgi:hypothetical protein